MLGMETLVLALYIRESFKSAGATGSHQKSVPSSIIVPVGVLFSLQQGFYLSAVKLTLCYSRLGLRHARVHCSGAKLNIEKVLNLGNLAIRL